MLKPLGIYATAIVQNVRVPLRHHGRLCVAYIALNSLDIAATQHELASGAGVSDAVKDHPSTR